MFLDHQRDVKIDLNFRYYRPPTSGLPSSRQARRVILNKFTFLKDCAGPTVALTESGMRAYFRKTNEEFKTESPN